METTTKSAAWREGYAAAEAEMAADGWTRETARRYLAAVASESGSEFGRGYDAAVAAKAEG